MLLYYDATLALLVLIQELAPKQAARVIGDAAQPLFGSRVRRLFSVLLTGGCHFSGIRFLGLVRRLLCVLRAW